jgi:uncharacterized protein YkwD
MRRSRALLALPLLVAALLPGVVRSGPDAGAEEAERVLTEAVVDWTRDHWRARMLGDPALANAAREHSEVLATGARLDTHEFLRQALSSHSVLDPFPYVFYGSGPRERLPEIESQLLQHLGRLPAVERRFYTHVAIGIHERLERRFLRQRRQWFVTVLLTQRAVTFSPIPEGLRPGERFLFEGEIHPPFRQPQLLLTRPDGNTDVLENYAVDAGHFRTYVRLGEHWGEYQLEVMGRYDMGPRVLGLCSLFLREPGQQLHYERLLAAARAGTLEPSRVSGRAEGGRSEREAEEILLRLVNRDREKAGVEPLYEDTRLSNLARAHSMDMRDQRYFAHVSPTSGRLSERAEKSEIAFRRIGENIAIGSNVYEAQEALMRSPGHRMNLLDPKFTHVGLGVVFDKDPEGRRRIYLTQNFLVPLRQPSRRGTGD